MKSLSFCEIWNNSTPPVFFIKPLTNKCPGHGVYDKILDGFQDLSKLKNPGVIKANV